MLATSPFFMFENVLSSSCTVFIVLGMHNFAYARGAPFFAYAIKAVGIVCV